MLFKNKTAIMLVVVLFIQLLNIPIYAEDNTETASDINKTIVSQLGLFDFTDREDVPVTRAEFAMTAYKIMNFKTPGEPAGKGNIYSDVGQWHWAAGYIEYLTEQSILSGVDNGIFEPDSPILLGQAYKVLLDIAGYGEIAMLNGGYPNGYLWAANEYGLIIPGEASDTLSAESLAQLLNKMLEINVMQIDFHNSQSYSYGTGSKVYEVLFGLEKMNDVLVGVSGMSLDDRNVGENEMIIGGKTYTGSAENAKDLLGLSVLCYYDPDDLQIYAIADNGKNEVITVNSSDITEFKTGECSYQTDNRIKTVRFAAGTDFVKNGNQAPVDFVPSYGTVKFIDNNKDGKYEVVLCEECLNIYVESIDTENGIIYAKNTDETGLQIKIDLNDYESIEVFQQEKQIALEDIVPNTLLSVYEGNEHIRIIYNTKTINGTVSQINPDEENKSLTLNNEDEYGIAPNGYFEVYGLGSSIQAFTDPYGKIGAVLKQSSNEYELGYVISSAIDFEGYPVIWLKMLKSSGDIETFKCQESIDLNGKKVKEDDFESVQSLLNTQQLIRYRAADGMIKAVDTAVQKPISDNSVTETEKDALIERASISSVYYKRSVNVIKRYQQKDGDFDGEMAVSADTVVFKVPEPGTTKDSDSFRVITVSELPDNELTDSVVKLYTDSGDSLTAKAMVWINNSLAKVPDSSKMFLVDKIYEACNTQTGEIGYNIAGLVDGEMKEYFVEDEELLDSPFGGKRIEQGDVIRVYVGNSGKITMIDPVYSKNVTEYPGEDPEHKTKSWVTKDYPVYGASFDVGLRIILGYEKYLSGGYMLFAYYNDASTPEVVKAASVPVYVYDENARKNKVYLGTVDDINHAGILGANCDTLIVNQGSSNVREIVVIKNDG